MEGNGKQGLGNRYIKTAKKDSSCIITQVELATQQINTQYPGVILQTKWDNSNDVLNLIMLHVPKSMRRRGIARYVLQLFCTLADRLQFNMILQPSSTFGTPLHVLIGLYLKYGFHIQPCNYMYRCFK